MVPDVSRRTALSGLGTAVFGSCTVLADRVGSDVAPDERDAGTDWPMARYDAAGTGYNPDAVGPKRAARVKWRRRPERFSGGVASPVLLGDTLYAIGRGLVALDAATGATRFSREGPYRSSPARADAEAYETDTLAVTAPTGVYGLNAGGGIRLFDYEFGVERWHGSSREPSFDFFGSPSAVPPVTVGSTVYATVPGPAPDAARIVALDASSGRELWRRSSGDELRRLAFRDGTLFAVNWPFRVSAYDATTADRLWTRDLDEQMVLAPTATDDAVVVPHRTGVVALDSRDGSVRWRFRHDGNATEGAAAVADGRVFVASAGDDGSLFALDLATGDVLWSAPVLGERTPVVADGVVYVSASFSSELVALDAATGAVRWRFETGPASPPAVGDGVLYVVSHGRVVALEEGR
ncbi:outer membrane protein assembly factor BamB family protein [Haladaptatus salinisoli]|uniref:outer membrane protein assembly factor BamB family protein n=1 Tax=Haladaptatus salinisoli TaxID=2884876 RepID=UPI001D0B1278|nr:PQQ-binding-like beta-propeller repeat protein [Haladaptatus salinisoli]